MSDDVRARDASKTLASWIDTPTRRAIVEFVDRATTEGGADYVPPPERVAVFDNDGTLWCEKPMPIELGFILHRLAEMCEADASLRDRQPWKAAYERDYAWLGDVITKHYHGDDSDVKVLMGGILRAFGGMTVEAYQAIAAEFLSGPHPTLGRTYRQCGYVPMIELLRYLEANGFTSLIASGGDRDFMRPVTDEIYGIPTERVIGSSNASAIRRTNTGEHSCTSRSPMCSTTAQPSRWESGAASAGARSWRGAIPMATSRCCITPADPAVRGFGCLCFTTIPSVSSSTGGSRAVARASGDRRLDRGQHQERLGRGLRRA